MGFLAFFAFLLFSMHKGDKGSAKVWKKSELVNLLFATRTDQEPCGRPRANENVIQSVSCLLGQNHLHMNFG